MSEQPNTNQDSEWVDEFINKAIMYKIDKPALYIFASLKSEYKQELLKYIQTSVQEAEQKVRNKGHKQGYYDGISNFSGYFMDASLKSQRNLIFPDIAKELIDNYKYPIWKPIYFNQLKDSSKKEQL